MPVSSQSAVNNGASDALLSEKSVPATVAIEKLPSFFDPARYPDYHAPHIALLDGYIQKLRQQEEANVAAGHPAEGLADFLVSWFYAWDQRDVSMIRNLLSDDLRYTDPSGGAREFVMTRRDLSLYFAINKLCPDFAYYPQDDTPRALPYYDFLNGVVRMTVPWRALGRWKFTPRHFDVVGVDRYIMTKDERRGWLIQRIDTDLDFLSAIGQILPVPLRPLKQNTQHKIMKIAQAAIPALRLDDMRPFAIED